MKQSVIILRLDVVVAAAADLTVGSFFLCQAVFIPLPPAALASPPRFLSHPVSCFFSIE